MKAKWFLWRVSAVVKRLGENTGAGMKNRIVTLLCLALATGFGLNSTAAPLGISVYAAQYTTAVEAGYFFPFPGPAITNISRTLVSPVPIEDALYYSPTADLEAEATTAPLAISAFTSAALGTTLRDRFRWSVAQASGELWFTPLTSETSRITLNFWAWYEAPFYSEGFVRLVDVTTGQQLWHFGWDFEGQGSTVPWVFRPAAPGAPDHTAVLMLDTGFARAHTYQLSMYTATDSNVPDQEQVVMQLSGLEIVPFAFDGFLAPLGGADATGGTFRNPLRTFQSKSTIPVKCILNQQGAPVRVGMHRLQVIKYADESRPGSPIDAKPQGASASGNVFRLTGNEWHFNLDTAATRMGPGVWQLRATLSDGSQHTAWIRIK